jgi:hypothetical protein
MFKHTVLKKLDKISKKLDQILGGNIEMTQELDTLTIEVAEIKTEIDSAIALLNGLSAILLEIQDDPAAIAALAIELDTKANELAAAVVANTPTQP